MTLRQVGKAVGVTHAYVSQMECGKFPPPKDVVLLALAGVLDEDPDILLIMAGRVPVGLIEVIQEHSREFTRLIQQLRGASKETLSRMARDVRDGKW